MFKFTKEQIELVADKLRDPRLLRKMAQEINKEIREAREVHRIPIDVLNRSMDI